MNRVYLLLLAGALSGCVVTQDWDRFQFGETDAGPSQSDGGMDGGPAPDGGPGDDAGMDAGRCVPAAETCDGADQDCDGTIDEHPTECAFPNATTACDDGECVMGECEAGFADCDESAPGCELDVRADPSNCGGCGVTCGPTEVCVASACTEPGITVLGMVQGGGRFEALAASPGRVFVGGEFNQTTTLDSDSYTPVGVTDGLLLGAGTDLTHEWGLQIGGAGAPVKTSAIASDRLGVTTIVGSYRGEISPFGAPWADVGGSEGFVVSVDPLGAVRWARQYVGNDGDPVRDVAVDGDGLVHALAYTFSPTLLVWNPSGSLARLDPAQCMVIVKHTALGGVTWARTFEWCDGPEGLTVGPDGRIAVFGTLEDFSSPAIIGSYQLHAATGWNPVVASFDASGTPQWAKLWTCSAGDGYVRDAVFGPSGDLFVVVHCDGASTLGGISGAPGILARLDPAGEVLWARPINHAGASQPTEIELGPDGRIYVAGRVWGDFDLGDGAIPASSGSKQHFVASFDADGQNRWSLLFGGLGDLQSGGLAVEEGGTVLASFSFGGVLEIDGVVYTPSPGATMVLRLTEP